MNAFIQFHTSHLLLGLGVRLGLGQCEHTVNEDKTYDPINRALYGSPTIDILVALRSLYLTCLRSAKNFFILLCDIGNSAT